MSLQKQKPSLQVAARICACWKSSARIRKPFCASLPCRPCTFTRGPFGGGAAGRRVPAASFDLRILHEEKVDHEAERARLQKEKQKLEQQLAQVRGQLEQPGFSGARAQGSCARR